MLAVLKLIAILSFLVLAAVSFLAGARFMKLYRKKGNKEFLPPLTIGLNVVAHLFDNKYKEDKNYEILIWIFRITLIVFIACLILYGNSS